MSLEFKWLAACAVFAAGEACGMSTKAGAALWPVVAASAGLAGLFGYGLAVRGWCWPVVFLCALALSWRAAEAERRVLDGAVRFASGSPYACLVEVEGPAERRTGRDGSVWWSFPGAIGPVGARVVVRSFADGGRPLPGEVWACAGWLARQPPPSGMRRLFWVSGPGTFARRAERRSRLSAGLERVRADFSRRIGIGLEHDRLTADLNRAILLGERSRIDPAVKEGFVAAGTIHLFAISGLHVMIVARALLFFLLLASVPLRIAQLAVLPLLWGYVFLVGAPPSAVRAAAMASFYFVAPACWRRPNALLSWAFTFLSVYGCDPWKLADAGCGLSFAVMLALVLWSRWASRVDLPVRWATVGVTVVAWSAGVPIAARVFGRVTPGGLVANLVAVPIAAGSVVGGLVGILVSFVSVRLAAHVNNAAALFTRLTTVLSQVVAELPGANLCVEKWSLIDCFAWYLAVFVLFFALARIWRRRF